MLFVLTSATGTAERWLEDAVEAFAIAEQIGQRLVIIGCSTGGSLAYWLAAQPWALPKIDVIVLVSPAFALHPLSGYEKLKHAVHWCPRLLRPLLLRWALGMAEREIDCSKFPEVGRLRLRLPPATHYSPSLPLPLLLGD